MVTARGLLGTAVALTVVAVLLELGAVAAADDPAVLAAVALILLPMPLLVGAAWGVAWLGSPARRTVVGTGAALAAAGLLTVGPDLALPVASYMAAGVAGAWTLALGWRWSAVIAVTALALAPLAVRVAGEQSVTEFLAADAERAREALAAGLPEDMDGAERAAALSEQRQRIDRIVQVTATIWPGTMALGLLAIAAGIAVLERVAALRLLGWPAGRPLVSFGRWRLPFAVVWVLVAGLAVVILRVEGTATAGYSLLLFAASLLAVQGLAVQVHVIGRLLATRWQVVYWLVAGLFFAPLVLFSGVLLGLVDQWFDIRRLDDRRNGPSAPPGRDDPDGGATDEGGDPWK